MKAAGAVYLKRYLCPNHSFRHELPWDWKYALFGQVGRSKVECKIGAVPQTVRHLISCPVASAPYRNWWHQTSAVVEYWAESILIVIDTLRSSYTDISKGTITILIRIRTWYLIIRHQTISRSLDEIPFSIWMVLRHTFVILYSPNLARETRHRMLLF